MSTAEIHIATAWHHALNAGDIDQLTALSSEDVEVGGPRGSGRGAQVLREWVSRAGIRLDIRRIYHRGAITVVEEHAEWRAPDTGQVTGSQAVASVFRVHDGRVASVVRYPSLADALHAARLSEADEFRQA